MEKIKYIQIIALLFITINNSVFSKDFVVEGNAKDSMLTITDCKQKYILLPIENSAPLVNMVLNDSQHINVRCALNNVDYYIPINIKENNIKSIFVKKLSKQSLFYSKIKYSNRYIADKNEKYRPIYHFTPLYGWMNDPNGMVYYDGLYHLSYQYNPYGSTWANMTWGHAVSKDLIHWQRCKNILYTDSLGSIYSGSAILDSNNKSGFGEKSLLAFYTSNCYGRLPREIQSLAYSNDGGFTYTKYNNNPILVDSTCKVDFRDPKVFYHKDTKRWIMCVAAGHCIKFFSSTNLKEWKYESTFGGEYNNPSAIWECPDLVELTINGNKKWVLILSHANGIYKTSSNQYFIGDFNGTNFICNQEPTKMKWIDYGMDNYAATTWSNVHEPLYIGWMSSWKYAGLLPTRQFRGAMTIVKRLFLFAYNNDLYVGSVPVKNQDMLRGKMHNFKNFIIDNYTNNAFNINNNGAFELNLDIDSDKDSNWGFRLLNKLGEYIDINIDNKNGVITFDRTHSGKKDFCKGFPIKTYAPIYDKKCNNIRLYIDKCSVELFSNGGKSVMTNLIYPNEPYETIKFYSKSMKSNVKMNYFLIK